PIDVSRSTITVRVLKSGLFSAFAHNHQITAPIVSGSVTPSGSLSVALRVDARKLRVMDPEVSAGDRSKIQATMQGAEVLDAERFPDIAFASKSVERKGSSAWIVSGDLTLHGQTRAVSFDATLSGGHYRGVAEIRQSDFGIAPIRIAGGAVK